MTCNTSVQMCFYSRLCLFVCLMFSWYSFALFVILLICFGFGFLLLFFVCLFVYLFACFLLLLFLLLVIIVKFKGVRPWYISEFYDDKKLHRSVMSKKNSDNGNWLGRGNPNQIMGTGWDGEIPIR